ncbi:uncharacterized protein LOC107039580 [Diachasma alloeum]|uniref:uncharacterized protein LOC107039580 n=1 Tax=Diachasma alloeum TaxID=454923 RepID=UPI0007382475|nr:uncharacterized protein LOC107039580 [Diachasma alloeum]XP_015114768.1 uncharacterized protein LOC107039580 [Diachasma alloeum]
MGGNMEEELSQAVSFVNSYFALVDGLASDLEDHLADDVVLDWFGQTIKGRKDVASFMKYQKIKSRHVFNEITPKTSIGYREHRSLRRKHYSTGGIPSNNNPTADESESQSKYKRKCYSDAFTQHPHNLADDSIIFDTSLSEPAAQSDPNSSADSFQSRSPEVTDHVIESELNMEGLRLDSFMTPQLTCQPHSGDSGGHHCTSETPDTDMTANFQPTNMDEMEMNIAELKAKDLVKREIGQGDADKSSLKFLEACGVIEFCKYFNSQQIRKDTRKRHSKLQIAYSIKDENSNPKIFHCDQRSVGGEGHEDDYEEERNQFLECLQLQMNKQEGNINTLSTPKYVRGQLKFDKFKGEGLGGAGDSNFIFKYKIHVIIYESNTKCRLNLSNEFEGKEYLEDDGQ